MLAFGCNTVFTFYTLYLSLCSAFFLFDWQIAIISSKMVAPTLRHQIAIRLARGMHLSSAVQADVSTCSGVVRLLLLSLQLRKPSGIGLLWVVGRKFLFFPSLCLAIHLCFLSFTRYSCLIGPWNFRHSTFGLFWMIWCLRRRLVIKSDLLVSSHGKFADFWVSSVLCRTSASWRIVCFFLVLGNLVHGDSSLLLLWFYLWVGSVIRNRRLILGLCGW